MEGAIKTYELLLSIANKSSAGGGRRQSALLNGLAFVYRQMGRHSEARQTFENITTLWSQQGEAEPLWVAASKNVGISFFDEGLVKEGTTSFGSLRTAVRKGAGNRDSLVEIDILRTMAEVLVKNKKIKEGELANRQADLIEKRLAGRR